MDYAVTFLEGVITFISPCLLPMLPIYLAYFAGDAAHADEGGARRSLAGALAFVLGFTLVFTLLGAFAGSLGSLLVRYRRALEVVCGIVVIALGLNYLGVLRIPGLERSLKPSVDPGTGSLWRALLFGMVFAVGWTPCVGTFLASALSLAASSASALKGVALLACFSAGLGLPFVLSAVLIEELQAAFSWIKEHYRAVELVSGILLIAVGVLMASGYFGLWLAALAG